MKLKDQIVFITGASRGIGKECALACAKEGAHVVIAAKSAKPHPKLPGTIGETADEVRALGRKALAIELDVRDADACAAAVEQSVDEFGRLDVLINNAGALWWADVHDTPMKRYDLVMGVNVRASYALSYAALKPMMQQKYGHIVMMSPAVDTNAIAHHTAYAISKFGMTMVAQGIAEEYREYNIAANALWPKTAIETQATIQFGLGEPKIWRKPAILADALLAIISKEPSKASGKAWIDEDLLRAEGVSDFAPYRCDPDHEPPALGLKDIPPVHAGLGN